jgi:co-chaperonin GroES (HSP10)
LKLLGNRVLIAPLSVAEISPGGIRLPANYQEGASTGQFRVVAVGTGWVTRKGKRIAIKDLVPGENVLVDLQGDHTILEDGTRIVRLEQIQMAFR